MKNFIILTFVVGITCWDVVIKGPSSVQTGDTLSLSCNATGLESPPETVIWYKGYEQLNPSEKVSVTVLQSPWSIMSKLTIDDVQQQDSGKYKCWVSNEIISHFTVAVVGSSGRTDGGSSNSGNSLKSTSVVILTFLLKVLLQEYDMKCFI